MVSAARACAALPQAERGGGGAGVALSGSGPVRESRESDCTQGAACRPHWVAATAVCGARAGPEAPAAWSGTAHDACTVGQSRHPQFASAAAHTPVRTAFVVAGQGPPPARPSDLCWARGLADDSSCVIAQFALLTMTMLGGEAGYIECTFRSAPCACPCVFRLHLCMRIFLVGLGLLSLTPCAACAHCMLGVLTTRLLCPPPSDGAGDFDGQSSGHDYYGTLWMPPTGFVNNCDGGRSHSYCDYRQQ